jgi:uncharacterized protein
MTGQHPHEPIEESTPPMEESSDSPKPIEGVGTAVAAFIGAVDDGPVAPGFVYSWREFTRNRPGASALGQAVEEFFRNGGSAAWIAPVTGLVREAVRSAIRAMDPDVALVAVASQAPAPPEVIAAAADALSDRRALLLVEGPWADAHTAIAAMSTDRVAALGAGGADVAVYWPRLRRSRASRTAEEISPLGPVAGMIARTDATRGVHRAPGGSVAVLRDVIGATVEVTRGQEDELNRLGVNLIRTFPRIGTVVWGTRTQAPDGEWKYVPVRRTHLYIAESLDRGLGWVVFEPNHEPLWDRVRLAVESFLFDRYREGAFAGAKPEHAFFVRCDRTTMTQDDIDAGRLVCSVGIAPLKPAEFVVFAIVKQTADAGG